LFPIVVHHKYNSTAIISSGVHACLFTPCCADGVFPEIQALGQRYKLQCEKGRAWIFQDKRLHFIQDMTSPGDRSHLSGEDNLQHGNWWAQEIFSAKRDRKCLLWKGNNVIATQSSTRKQQLLVLNVSPPKYINCTLALFQLLFTAMFLYSQFFYRTNRTTLCGDTTLWPEPHLAVTNETFAPALISLPTWSQILSSYSPAGMPATHGRSSISVVRNARSHLNHVDNLHRDSSCSVFMTPSSDLLLGMFLQFCPLLMHFS
jgi:hypothetical protein